MKNALVIGLLGLAGAIPTGIKHEDHKLAGRRIGSSVAELHPEHRIRDSHLEDEDEDEDEDVDEDEDDMQLLQSGRGRVSPPTSLVASQAALTDPDTWGGTGLLADLPSFDFDFSPYYALKILDYNVPGCGHCHVKFHADMAYIFRLQPEVCLLECTIDHPGGYASIKSCDWGKWHFNLLDLDDFLPTLDVSTHRMRFQKCAVLTCLKLRIWNLAGCGFNDWLMEVQIDMNWGVMEQNSGWMAFCRIRFDIADFDPNNMSFSMTVCRTNCAKELRGTDAPEWAAGEDIFDFDTDDTDAPKWTIHVNKRCRGTISGLFHRNSAENCRHQCLQFVAAVPIVEGMGSTATWASQNGPQPAAYGQQPTFCCQFKTSNSKCRVSSQFVNGETQGQKLRGGRSSRGWKAFIWYYPGLN